METQHGDDQQALEHVGIDLKHVNSQQAIQHVGIDLKHVGVQQTFNDAGIDLNHRDDHLTEPVIGEASYEGVDRKHGYDQQVREHTGVDPKCRDDKPSYNHAGIDLKRVNRQQVLEHAGIDLKHVTSQQVLQHAGIDLNTFNKVEQTAENAQIRETGQVYFKPENVEVLPGINDSKWGDKHRDNPINVQAKIDAKNKDINQHYNELNNNIVCENGLSGHLNSMVGFSSN